MKTTAHLNLKWSVRDIDTIKRKAQEGRTAYAIALWFTRNGKPAATDEIIRICADMGVRLRRSEEKRVEEPA